MQAGDTVLVHGGSGGVGLMVIQLATARGARVIATASPARHEQLRALGAEPIAYGGGAAALAERVRALAGDGVSTPRSISAGTDEALDASLELVADRSRIASIVAFARGPEAGHQGARRRSRRRPRRRDPGRRPARAGAPRSRPASCRSSSATTFPLEPTGVGRAHQAIVDGRGGGKFVLLP